MEMSSRFLLVFSLLIVLVESESTTCNITDQEMLSKAFRSVSGFNLSWFQPADSNCSLPIKEIRLSSRNLSGIISWKYLKNMSELHVVDLSSNSLQGHVPGWFWSIQSLEEVNLAENKIGGTIGFEPNSGNASFSSIKVLNLSTNRFTNLGKLSGFPNLRVLDLSRNNLGSLPSGFSTLTKLESLNISSCNISGNIRAISGLHSLKSLDVSNNTMNGTFPSDFPSLDGLMFLNVSLNNFTGTVHSDKASKFGNSAFLHGGSLNFTASKSPSNPIKPQSKAVPPHIKSNPKHPAVHKNTAKKIKSKSKTKTLIVCVSSISTFLLVSIGISALCMHRRRKLAARNKWAIQHQ